MYPGGYNIDCQYDLSASSLPANDTLVLIRTISNNESFGLTGLYFSENLPTEFEIIEHSVKINGSDISDQFTGNISPSVVNGYNTCEWLIDSPSGNPVNVIYTGQELTFEFKVICNTPGDYQLPFHTSSFYGNGQGFFTTDNQISVIITEPPDTTPPADISDLQAPE